MSCKVYRDNLSVCIVLGFCSFSVCFVSEVLICLSNRLFPVYVLSIALAILPARVCARSGTMPSLLRKCRFFS